MLKISSFLALAALAALAALVAGFFVVTTSVNAQQMFKCKVNGTVTYQQEPCPTGQIRKPPAVQELNAIEQRRREAAAVAVEKPIVVQEKAAAYPQSTEKFSSPANPPKVSSSFSSFSCDGRKHCSQMKSCAEAHFFLANCPGVKMDGDKDGIPCEEQWCTR